MVYFFFTYCEMPCNIKHQTVQSRQHFLFCSTVVEFAVMHCGVHGQSQLAAYTHTHTHCRIYCELFLSDCFPCVTPLHVVFGLPHLPIFLFKVWMQSRPSALKLKLIELVSFSLLVQQRTDVQTDYINLNEHQVEIKCIFPCIDVFYNADMIFM